MSSTYALPELARADPEAIWVYTAEQWDVEQAERYLQGLFDCLEELAANPRPGRQRDDVKAGYRSFPQGRRRCAAYKSSTALISTDLTPRNPQENQSGQHF